MTRRIVDDIGLPPPVLAAITRGFGGNSYKPAPGSYRVSGLLAPPLQAALLEKHGDDITEQASDFLFRLKGSAVHAVLEQVPPLPGDAVERRLSAVIGGRTVTGTLDYYEHTMRTLWDVKNTSVWKIIRAQREGVAAAAPDWLWQVRAYAYLAQRSGVEVERAGIIWFAWDWRAAEARRDEGYPEFQAGTLDVPLCSYEEAEAWLSERIAAHERARAGYLTVCTPEERWARPSQWAVTRKGNKRAAKLHDTEAEAQAHAAELYEKTVRPHVVEERPGDAWVRCRGYCAAAAFCPHFAAVQEAETVTLRGENLTVEMGA